MAEGGNEPKNRPRSEYPSALGLQWKHEPVITSGGAVDISNSSNRDMFPSSLSSSSANNSTVSQNVQAAPSAGAAATTTSVTLTASSISTHATSNKDKGFTTENAVAYESEEQPRYISETLGFDLDFDPNEYVPSYNQDGCVDRERFNRASPQHRYANIKHNVLTGDSENYECSICITKLVDFDYVRLLVCKHAFHARCIDPWMLQANSGCPLCRAN